MYRRQGFVLEVECNCNNRSRGFSHIVGLTSAHTHTSIEIIEIRCALMIMMGLYVYYMYTTHITCRQRDTGAQKLPFTKQADKEVTVHTYIVETSS